MKLDPADSVHPTVRVGAAWTWRLLVLAAGVAVLGVVLKRLEVVVVPVALALLVSALLTPLVNWMHRRRVPRAIAVVLAIVVGIAVVVSILAFVVEQFVAGLPALTSQFTASIDGAQEWLTSGPLHFSEAQIRSAGDSAVNALESNQEAITSGALTTATVLAEILTGALLMLFTLIFFLYGGRQIWEFVTRLAPTAARPRIRIAGDQAFGSLVGYVRATVVVAASDAVGIGIGLALLGVPLALPLASLVFVGAFVPVVGAVLTGFVAVLVALVTQGVVTALLALAVVIAVMQIEGHVLQPLLLGRAVRIHPLAVVLAIATGIVLAGIIGGLLAVPLVAMANTAVRSLLADDPHGVVEDPLAPAYPAAPDSADTPDGPKSDAQASDASDAQNSDAPDSPAAEDQPR